MINIPDYDEFLFEGASGNMAQAMTKAFGSGSWFGTTFFVDSWDWLKRPVATILQQCGFKPLRIAAYGSRIGVDLFGEGIAYSEDVAEWNADELKDWAKRTSEKPIDPVILKRMMWFWKSEKADEKVLDRRDQGHGIWSSTKVTKQYNKVYTIKGLDKVFGSKEAFEKAAKEHGMFKRDQLGFDWKGGNMYVGGTWVDTYD
jgi:hypothetical protein